MNSEKTAPRYLFAVAISLLFTASTYGASACASSERGHNQHQVKGAVTALAFSHDGKVLAVGRNGSVTLCDSGNGRSLASLTGIEGIVTSAAFADRGSLLAVGCGAPGRNGIIELWNWKSGHRADSLKGHNDLVYGIAIRSDGKQLAAASYDRLVSLWNLDSSTKQPLKAGTPHYLRDHTDSVYGVTYSPDGKMLASAAADRTVKVWDTETGKRLYTLSDSTGELYTLAFRPDGKQIAAGGADRTLRIWNVDRNGGVLSHSVFAHNGAILKIVYSHDGKEIFTSGEDNTVKQWNADTVEEKAVYPRQPDWPDAIAVSPNNRLLAVGRYDASVTLYDTVRHLPITAFATSRLRMKGSLNAVRYRSRAGAKLSKYQAASQTRGVVDSSPVSCRWSRLNEADSHRQYGVCSNDKSDDTEVKSPGGNESVAQAMLVPVPCVVNGTLWNGNLSHAAPSHYYRFAAKRGETLIIDVLARRSGSPLDSQIELLDTNGKPIERAVLRAVSQTEITLSDRDSASPGIRLLLRPEFQINDFVLAGRELMRIDGLPKGPDDDYLFRSYRGQRTGFLGTTPEFHTVGGQVYKVEVHPPGSRFSPNGMPLTHLFYKNDDGGPLYGRDSYMEFTPPADGDYILRLGDVRGQQGEKFTYRLRIHSPRPDFKVSLSPASIIVPMHGAAVVTVECERYEGFEGEIAVRLEGLPSGFSASEGTIESGETSAVVLITAAPDAVTPKPEMPASYRVTAKAMIGGKEVTHTVEPDDKSRRLSVGTASNVQIVTDRNEVTLNPGEDAVVEARITRLNGIKNRIPLDIRNLPFGVRVVNIGLNGVLINEGESTRKFTLHCDPWVKPQTRAFYVTANIEGGTANTAPALTLHVNPHLAISGPERRENEKR